MSLPLLDEMERLVADCTMADRAVLQLIVEEYLARPPDPTLPVEQQAEALLRRAYRRAQETSA